jgi:hypothetical protein
MTYQRPDRPTLMRWTDANRKARAATPVAWCEWPDADGRELCAQPAARIGLCAGHYSYERKHAKAAARARR